MSTALVLELRAEAAKFKAGVGEARSALRELRNEVKAFAGGPRLAFSDQNVAKNAAAAARAVAAEQRAQAEAAKKAAAEEGVLAAQNRTGATAANKLASETRAATAEIQRQAAALRLANLEAGGATKSMHQHTSAIKQALTTGLQLAAVYGTLRAAQASLGAGIEYNKTLEGAKLAIASVVAANEKVIDAQGKQIEGVEKLRVAQTQVASVMDQLVIKARETGTPIQVLVSGFQSAIAPASAAKMTLQETSEVVVGLTNAMKAMNVPLDQQRQEIQDILNADIDRNSHVAKNMQLNSSILKQWKEQGTLAENLLRLLKDYNVAAGEFKNTWSGATAVMKGNFEALMGVFTGPSFDVLKEEFKKLAAVFASDEGRDQAKEYGLALRDGLQTALDISYTIADVLKTTADGWMTLWRVVKGPEADLSYLNARNEAFAGGITKLGSKTLGIPGVPKEDQMLFPKGTQGIPWLPLLSETNLQDYEKRLPTNLTSQQRQAILALVSYSEATGEKARMGALGFPYEYDGSDPNGTRRRAGITGGYTTVPGGGAGGTSSADKEKAEKALRNALKLARAGREGVPQAREVVKAYEQFLGNKALDQGQLKVDLKAAKQELTQAIVKAAAEDAKVAGKLSLGAGLQAQVLADMPDESKALRDAGKKAIEDEAAAQKAADAMLKGIRSEGFRSLDRETATSTKLTAISLREQEAMGRIGNVDPGVALTKEIETRRAIVEAEFKAREDEAKRLREEDFQANYSKAIEIEEAAARERRVAMAEILSDERIGRMEIAELEGKRRLEIEQDVAEKRKRVQEELNGLMVEGAVTFGRLASAGLGKAVKGESLSASDIARTVGSFVDTVGGALAGGIVGIGGGPPGIGAGAVVGTGIGNQVGLFRELLGAMGDVIDKDSQKAIADALNQAGSMSNEAALKQLEAAATQIQAAQEQRRNAAEQFKTFEQRVFDRLSEAQDSKLLKEDKITGGEFDKRQRARETRGMLIQYASQPGVLQALTAAGITLPPDVMKAITEGTPSRPNVPSPGSTAAIDVPDPGSQPRRIVMAVRTEKPGMPDDYFAPMTPSKVTWSPITGEVGSPDYQYPSPPSKDPYDPSIAYPWLAKSPEPPPPETKPNQAASDAVFKAFGFTADQAGLIFNILTKVLPGIEESLAGQADRGTERNPLITQPPKRSAFDFAPRSFFFRGGRGGGGIPSGSTLRGLGGSSGGGRGRGAGGRSGGMAAV